MNKLSVEYVKSIRENIETLPDGYEVLNEGVEIGNGITPRRSLFLEESGYETYAAYKKDYADKGENTWEVLLGLATLEEQIDAIKEIYSYSQRTGLSIQTVQVIPSFLTALPKEYRDKAPKPTSYVIEKPEDWLDHQAGVPLQILFEDQVLSCPNSLETTVNSVKAGSELVGLVSQFIWSQPGFTDDRQHMIDMVKSIGIVKSKRDRHFVCNTYLDDGFPGYAMDCATYVGYALLEHYIVHDLCGARYQVSWGGLLSEGQNRLAVGLAIHELLSTEEQPALSYINGSTTMQWDHDIDANYGPSVQEMLLEALADRHYKLQLTINPVAITEKITTPTLQELLNIFSAGQRAMERASDWENIINWKPIEDIRDYLMEEGKKFFENTLNIMEAAGVNIKDPLEIFMTLKKLNPSKFEGTFHPRISENPAYTPKYPTVLGRDTLRMQEQVIADIKERGMAEDALKGERIVVVSGDGHAYGLLLVDGVLSSFGAKTVNGGVDIDPSVALDLADEEGITNIGISVHIGQSIDYARQIAELAKKRGKEYRIFMGGKLNAILPGKSEATDVTDLIMEQGIYASNDLYETIAMIGKKK
ncbi:MAG TPA: cobalamin-dependent protein [Candidatus Copromorpha excrementigallinarum]|uniref:Cobalamin-dependent protein n=1 Tax=Candidatus Allocopromorpha excrementigallinarum TaxID=2840742 RepID=A0A9D1I1S8_9FIRM|nr:cobalamin-dependent protein [Candidatus Copromorpha excrementigallinarum]